jgi:hypothetical protein
MASGSATIPTMIPAVRSAVNSTREYDLSVVNNFGTSKETPYESERCVARNPRAARAIAAALSLSVSGRSPQARRPASLHASLDIEQLFNIIAVERASTIAVSGIDGQPGLIPGESA